MDDPRAKLIRLFVISAGVLLLITGTAKLVSSVGSARVLRTDDPIFGLAFRYVLLAAAVVESAVGLFCLFGARIRLQVGLLAWLATSLLVYRFGLICVGYHKACGCLGEITQALHISSKNADLILNGLLVYFVVGSYIALLLESKRVKRPRA